MAQPRRYAFTPCGHRCVCHLCAVGVSHTDRRCPICRTKAPGICMSPLALGGICRPRACLSGGADSENCGSMMHPRFSSSHVQHLSFRDGIWLWGNIFFGQSWSVVDSYGQAVALPSWHGFFPGWLSLIARCGPAPLAEDFPLIQEEARQWEISVPSQKHQCQCKIWKRVAVGARFHLTTVHVCSSHFLMPNCQHNFCGWRAGATIQYKSILLIKPCVRLDGGQQWLPMCLVFFTWWWKSLMRLVYAHPCLKKWITFRDCDGAKLMIRSAKEKAPWTDWQRCHCWRSPTESPDESMKSKSVYLTA